MSPALKRDYMQVLYVGNFARYLSTFSFNLTGPGRQAPPPLPFFRMTYQGTCQKVTKLVNREANLFTAEESQSHVGPVAYTILLRVDNCLRESGKETLHFPSMASQPFSSHRGGRGSEHQEYIK